MNDAIPESDRSNFGCPACGKSGYYLMISDSRRNCSSCGIGYIVLPDGITESLNGKLKKGEGMSITDKQAAIIGERIGQAIENEMTHGRFAEKLGAGIAKGLLPESAYTQAGVYFAEILGKSIGEAIGKMKRGEG